MLEHGVAVGERVHRQPLLAHRKRAVLVIPEKLLAGSQRAQRAQKRAVQEGVGRRLDQLDVVLESAGAVWKRLPSHVEAVVGKRADALPLDRAADPVEVRVLVGEGEDVGLHGEARHVRLAEHAAHVRVLGDVVALRKLDRRELRAPPRRSVTPAHPRRCGTWRRRPESGALVMSLPRRSRRDRLQSRSRSDRRHRP